MCKFVGAAVAEVLVKNNPVPMTIAGIPDEEVPNGADTDVFGLLKLDEEGISEKAKELLKRKR